jgi:DNA-binding NarL/FixJ family response regulator
MSALIILVHADPRALRHTEALLSQQGFLVAALTSYAGAKHLLESVMPDLLIADLRLDAYNGLQLAISNHVHHPDLPVIITSDHSDPVAEAEAERYGAAFVTAPLENRDFLPAVWAAIAERRRLQRPIRRWFRRPVHPVVEVLAADTRATILDVSYGGVRLAFRAPGPIPTTFGITLPKGNVTVTAHRVWTADSADGDQVCCGAELTEAAADVWRQVVDSLRDLPDQQSPSQPE